MNRPDPLTVRQVSKLAMVAGGERRHPVIIHDGKVKRWVGFGWVTERDAEPADADTLPEVH